MDWNMPTDSSATLLPAEQLGEFPRAIFLLGVDPDLDHGIANPLNPGEVIRLRKVGVFFIPELEHERREGLALGNPAITEIGIREGLAPAGHAVRFAEADRDHPDTWHHTPGVRRVC